MSILCYCIGDKILTYQTCSHQIINNDPSPTVDDYASRCGPLAMHWTTEHCVVGSVPTSVCDVSHHSCSGDILVQFSLNSMHECVLRLHKLHFQWMIGIGLDEMPRRFPYDGEDLSDWHEKVPLPTAPYMYQAWIDTDTSTLKFRASTQGGCGWAVDLVVRGRKTCLHITGKVR